MQPKPGGVDAHAHAARVALALAALRGVGPVDARRRLREAGTLDEAFRRAAAEMGGDAEADALQRADALLTQCAERAIRVLPVTEAEYPTSLAALPDPPVVLFASGDLALAQRAAVAVVGARQASRYGRRVARAIAARLATRGAVVVSGMALGIDAEAHEGALGAGGGTIAVLGTGVDVPYPAAHTALHARIATQGLLLSELPPGRRAHAGAFPRRNRIIAALADVVVVVEAGARSGALITAQVAGEIGRVVAAVPGPIDDDGARGSNQLLRDGAHTLSAVDDVLGLLALTTRGRALGPDAPAGGNDADHAPNDDSAEGRVLAVLAHGARSADELVHACALAPRTVVVALSALVGRGAVEIDHAGFVRRALVAR